jgi:NitT/TauT family transport system ATP-binding protein
MLASTQESNPVSNVAAAGRAIELVGIGKNFGATGVLTDVNLSVSRGECVALIGASGCGKTTLLRILAGLETPSCGKATIFGFAPSLACQRHEIGMAFQRSALVPSRTALQNVELTTTITRKIGTLSPAALLARFGLGDSLHRYPHQLSGGMQQRVNIACALVHDPHLLLLDEPFGALDELTREDIVDWLAAVLEASRQTAILVTHSVDEAVTFADRIVVMARPPARSFEIIPIEFPRPRDRTMRHSRRYLEMTGYVKERLYAAIGAGRVSL